MPNIKSAIKRVKTSEERRALRSSQKSSMRTAIKRFEQTLESGNVEEAKNALIFAQKKLNKAVSKGLIHKNAASRKLSRMNQKLNKAQ